MRCSARSPDGAKRNPGCRRGATAPHSASLHAGYTQRPRHIPTTTRRPRMLPDSALSSMNVMFATPCYISGVSMNYVASVFSLALDSKHVGLPCILHLHSESL